MNTQITQWNPFKEMERMNKRLASLFDEAPWKLSLGREALTTTEWNPRVVITEDDKEFVIKAELPEVKKEDVKVTVEDGVLTLSGERKFEKEEKNKKYHRIESEYGSFVRSFTLPSGTSGEKIAAEFKDGVLRIHLPKEAKPSAAKTVEIKAS